MSFLGGLGGLLDPGKIVKEAVDAVLPEKLDVVADLAGAATSFYAGRPLQALGHLAQACRDLPQAFSDTADVPTGGSWRRTGSAAFQPTPPPTRDGNASELGFDKLISLLESLVKALKGDKPKGSSSSSKADDDAESASGSSSKKTSSSSSSTKKEETALDKLNKLSDAEFMAKVRKGDLPKEITDDPKAMLAIEQRVQHIAQMTRMMSQMMQALHDMQMAILQNVRV